MTHVSSSSRLLICPHVKRRHITSLEKRSNSLQWRVCIRSRTGSSRRQYLSLFSSQEETVAKTSDSYQDSDPVYQSKDSPAVFSNEGQVAKIRNGVVKISGMRNDAPFGTHLQFQNGENGVLLWRQSGDCCFGLVFNEAANAVQSGQSVTCITNNNTEDIKLSSNQLYLQYSLHLDEIPTGKVLHSHHTFSESSHSIPLLNSQLDMSSRQCIYQPLIMQHKGVDILTPIGRGQCIILAANSSKQLTGLAMHMIKAQTDDKSITSIYTCIGKSIHETMRIQNEFENENLLGNSVFIKSTEEDSISDQFAALCAALCIGETIRDKGSDALVIIDSIQSLLSIWNEIQSSPSIKGELDDDDLVEVDGTFMAAETAERRRFFSSILQRASKASDALGGGSLTLIPIVKGRPATGQQELKINSIKNNPKIPEALKEKLLAKLSSMTGQNSTMDSNRVPTFIIEELMSIADGQIVLEDEIDGGGGGVSIDPLLSVSRLGTRVYASGMENLAPQIRFALAQAADARQFDSESITEASQSWNAKLRVVKEALVQRSGDLCPLSLQLVTLKALESIQGDTGEVQIQLEKIRERVEELDRKLMEEIDSTGKITAVQETQILELIRKFF